MAYYKVIVARSAAKELKAIPKKDRTRLAARLRSLAAEPRPSGCKKLSGHDRYRIRQGPYRIIYAIDDSRHVVDVVGIRHRREAYRNLGG